MSKIAAVLLSETYRGVDICEKRLELDIYM